MLLKNKIFNFTKPGKKGLLFIVQVLFAGSLFAQNSIINAVKKMPLYVDEGICKQDWLLGNVKIHSVVSKSRDGKSIILSNGLVRRIFKISPDCATVALDNLMTGQSELRAVRPEATITINDKPYNIGGLQGQPVQNYLSNAFINELRQDTDAFHLTGFTQGVTVERFPWKRNEAWSSQKLPWPVPGVRLTFSYAPPGNGDADIKNITVKVIYELYDGMPIISKSVEINNEGKANIVLNSFKSEILAVTETAPKVAAGEPREYRILGKKNPPENGTQTDAPRDYIDRFTQLFVVTDYAMGGDMEAMKDNPGVRWVFDHPEYEKTGIRYYGEYQPARVECTPPIGPDIEIKKGQTWESFRAFELMRDATDDERRGLAERKFWRAMAPWTQENPILMHVLSAKPDAVKLAIDQCANVGFEMVIMTFGSGFNIENTDPAYLEQMKQLADYASSKGIAIGGYSLLASRGGNPEDLIISQKTGKPATNYKDGARFGETPCLATNWGTQYFAELHNYFNTTGMNVFENDGSYPGDPCASTQHSGHKGFEDSQWQQWVKVRDFYQWCRGKGIYLNVPDWYFLNGSSKTGMGYVETNWSLPREYQEIIERQDIYDGTWQKTPSMGWMFVPLTQYHGGGAAATIEPLNEHLNHYEHRMADLFGAGVQAIYRGPRLYDTDSTRIMVKKMVDFYKQHRAVLDADIIHLRRPDGRDWDGILHVNPQGKEKGLLMLYNPLEEDITRDIQVPLYYTGIHNKASVKGKDGKIGLYKLDGLNKINLTIHIPKHSYKWYIIQ